MLKKMGKCVASLAAVALLFVSVACKPAATPASSDSSRQAKTKVSKVVANPVAGALASATKVTLSTPTKGATVYYTIAGVEKKGLLDASKATVDVNQSLSIIAVAKKSGCIDSDPVTFAYTIATPKCAVVTANVASGTKFFSDTLSIELSSTTAGAKIYYTLDASVPTAASTLYENAISIDATKTLKAIAIKDSFDSSDIASFEYIKIASPTLMFSEYCEGASNNKYVELYNYGDDTIDLANYKFLKYSNGGDSATELPLEGSLPSKKCILIHHHELNDGYTIIKALSTDVSNAEGWRVDSSSKTLWFNGNDQLELQYMDSKIDFIGTPGSADFAKDCILIRKPTKRPAADGSYVAEDWNKVETTNYAASYNAGSYNDAYKTGDEARIHSCTINGVSATIDQDAKTIKASLLAVSDPSSVTFNYAILTDAETYAAAAFVKAPADGGDATATLTVGSYVYAVTVAVPKVVDVTYVKGTADIHQTFDGGITAMKASITSTSDTDIAGDITGVVSCVNNSKIFYIQDASDFVQIYLTEVPSLSVAPGDKVTITVSKGKVHYGQKEITAIAKIEKVSSGNSIYYKELVIGDDWGEIRKTGYANLYGWKGTTAQLDANHKVAYYNDQKAPADADSKEYFYYGSLSYKKEIVVYSSAYQVFPVK